MYILNEYFTKIIYVYIYANSSYRLTRIYIYIFIYKNRQSFNIIYIRISYKF